MDGGDLDSKYIKGPHGTYTKKFFWTTIRLFFNIIPALTSYLYSLSKVCLARIPRNLLPHLQGVYIDSGKTDLTSDKIKLYVRKNLTAAFCDMVGQFTRERLIHVLF